MSYSVNVKEELRKVSIDRQNCIKAEAYGMMCFGHTFSYSQIRIVTENSALRHRLPALFQNAFGFGFDQIVLPKSENAKNIFIVENKQKIDGIFRAYGYALKNTVALHLNFAELEDELCRAAFLRGAFFTGGSVTDPEKKYHLELVTPHYYLCREVVSLLLDMDFQPKQTTRKSNYVIYFKASEQIEDFLTVIGAPLAAISLMNTKVEKDFRNRINRKVNCETANLGKTVAASQDQITAIRAIEQAGTIDALSSLLQETAKLRLSNPEATLSELAAMHKEPLGKSGLNHRLRKLVEIGKEIQSGSSQR